MSQGDTEDLEGQGGADVAGDQVGGGIRKPVVEPKQLRTKVELREGRA